MLIDHGSIDTSVIMPAFDLAGNPRPQNGRSDIGCYESPYSGITLPTYPDSIIYVTATGAGLRNGTSWDNALDDINEAVILSASSGYPPVWVAQGTYYGDTAASGAFHFLERVNIYGGFAGNEPPPTTLPFATSTPTPPSSTDGTPTECSVKTTTSPHLPWSTASSSRTD